MSEVIWRLRRVMLRGGSPHRLSDVNLDIHRGITAVLGCSGAGKTSLLNLLVGFERPDRGRVEAHLPNENGLRLYWSPQNGGLWEHMSALEHVRVALQHDDETRAKEILESFDLAGQAHHRPQELSQGERSRLGLARAMASEARVLVLDEPLANVDAARLHRFWGIVRNHACATGTSLVYSTHAARMVLGEADRVICLSEGKVIHAGKVEELYEDPPSRAAAECLGETNWFEPAEAARWLGLKREQGISVRPERIRLEVKDDGPMLVKESRFKGGTAETRLLHEESGKERVFHHGVGTPLRAGLRVCVRLLICLLLGLLIGCSKSEPTLDFEEVRVWSMPPDGPRIPKPRALAVSPEGETYALDTAGRVLVLDGRGKLARQWWMPEYSVGKPEGLIVMRDGRIAVADTHYSRVVFFDKTGNVLGMFGKEGKGKGEFSYPVSLAEDEEGYLYVAEYGGNDRVQVFDSEYQYVATLGRFGTDLMSLQRPSGIAVVTRADGARLIYVADAINNRMQVFLWRPGSSEAIETPANQPKMLLPYGIAYYQSALYMMEYSGGCLTKVDPSGNLIGRFGRTGREVGEFNTPWNLTVAPDGRVLVADTGNSRIIELIP